MDFNLQASADAGRQLRMLDAVSLWVNNTNELQLAISMPNISSIMLSRSSMPYYLSEELVISRNLTLEAESDFDVVLDGQRQCRLMSVRVGAHVQLLGLTLRHGEPQGWGAAGGAISLNRGTTAVLERCVIEFNRASLANAGALYMQANAYAHMTACRFSHNDARVTGQGGAIFMHGLAAATISDCVFVNNTAGGAGGALLSDGAILSLTRCVFDRNQVVTETDKSGGAIYSQASSLIRMVGCDFSNNGLANTNSATSGSTLFFANPNSRSLIVNCSFSAEVEVDKAIVINAPIQWVCPLGHYMPTTGTFPASFAGCLYKCPRGYFGDRPDLVAASGVDGCEPCSFGHCTLAFDAPPLFDVPATIRALARLSYCSLNAPSLRLSVGGHRRATAVPARLQHASNGRLQQP